MFQKRRARGQTAVELLIDRARYAMRNARYKGVDKCEFSRFFALNRQSGHYQNRRQASTNTYSTLWSSRSQQITQQTFSSQAIFCSTATKQMNIHHRLVGRWPPSHLPAQPAPCPSRARVQEPSRSDELDEDTCSIWWWRDGRRHCETRNASFKKW